MGLLVLKGRGFSHEPLRDSKAADVLSFAAESAPA
jgi:hypothetical protein